MLEPNIASDPANLTPPTQPVSPGSLFGLQPEPRHGIFRWVLLGLIVLILGGGAYAGVYAYNRGYLASSLIDKWLHRDDPVAFMVKKIDEAKSGKFQLSVNVAINQSNGTEPVLPTVEGELPAKIRARVAELKSDVAQVRTGLALYYDDHNAYAKELSQLVPNYLAKDIFDDIEYAPSSDFKHYTLTGTITANKESATYSINDEGTINDKTEELTSDADVSNVVSLFLDYLPEDIKIRAYSSYFFSNDDKGVLQQSRGSLSGSYSSGGTSFSYDADALTHGEDSYVRIKEVPTFPGFDFSQLTGKWISLTKEDNLQLLPGDEYLSSLGDVDASSLRSLTSVSVPTNLLSLGLETGYISPGEKQETAVLDGNKFDRYTFTINQEKRSKWREALIESMRASCKDDNCIFDSVIDNDDVLEQIENDPFLDAVLQIQSLEVFIHRNHKEYRMHATTALRFPDSSALSNKAITFTFEYSIGNFGESPEVIRPKDVTPFDEAKRQMLGYTSEQWKFMKQKTNVTTLRTSLKRYYDEKQKYPDSLDALLGDASETSMRNMQLAQVMIDDLSLPNTDEGKGKSYVLSYIPTDVFTGKPYEYVNDGPGYTLTYDMKFPNPSEGDGRAYFSDYETKAFVEGNNVADEYVISREAIATKDNDYDGLNGVEELVYNTDPTKPDTDGDGAKDKTEVDSKTDPLDPTSKPRTTSTTPYQAPTTYFPPAAKVGDDIVAKRYEQPFAGTEGTIHFWVRSENWSANSYMHMVNFHDSQGIERLLIRYAKDEGTWVSFILYPDGGSFVGWSAYWGVWPKNTWTHIAITWNVGEVPKMYVNGTYLNNYISKEQESQVLTQNMAAALSRTGILYLNGRKNSDGGNTEVEDFVVLHSKLSEQELASIASSGGPKLSKVVDKDAQGELVIEQSDDRLSWIPDFPDTVYVRILIPSIIGGIVVGGLIVYFFLAHHKKKQGLDQWR